MQASSVIPLLYVWMFHSIFGMVVEVKQMSTKDRLERKKYMGVWMWEYGLTTRIMSRFPNTVIRYMDRKLSNMRDCSFDSSDIQEEEIVNLGIISWSHVVLTNVC